MIEGKLSVNNEKLSAGDAAALSEESAAIISADSDSHFLLFDLGGN